MDGNSKVVSIFSRPTIQSLPDIDSLRYEFSFLDLSLLTPGQTLTFLFYGRAQKKANARISFLITQKSGSNETSPLIGRISGCNLNKEMENACIEGGLPIPPIKAPFAILGDCETCTVFREKVTKNLRFNSVSRGKNLFLLAYPYTQMEYLFAFSNKILSWLIH